MQKFYMLNLRQYNWYYYYLHRAE